MLDFDVLAYYDENLIKRRGLIRTKEVAIRETRLSDINKDVEETDQSRDTKPDQIATRESTRFPIITLFAFVSVVIVGVFLLLNPSWVLVKVMMGIAGLGFLLAIGILVMKLSGLGKMLKLRNPTGIYSLNYAAVFALLAIAASLILGVCGGMYGVIVFSKLGSFVDQFQASCPWWPKP